MNLAQCIDLMWVCDGRKPRFGSMLRLASLEQLLSEAQAKSAAPAPARAPEPVIARTRPKVKRKKPAPGAKGKVRMGRPPLTAEQAEERKAYKREQSRRRRLAMTPEQREAHRLYMREFMRRKYGYRTHRAD